MAGGQNSYGTRTPPHHLEAERSVLGAIFVQNDCVDRVTEIGLEAADFYKDSHQKIFECALALTERREPVDLVTMTATLRDRGWLEQIGGTAAMTDLFDGGVYAIGNVTHYAKIVRDKAVQRRLIEACGEIIGTALEGVDETESFLDESETKIFSVTNAKLNKSFVPLKSVISENITTIENLALRKDDVTGFPSGFTEFDRLTTGLHPGQLIVVAGRPGMGKSGFYLSSLLHTISKGCVTAIFSMEMAAHELGFRMLSGLSRIDSQRMKKGRLQDRDWHRFAEAADILSKAKIMVDDSGGLTVMDIRARCRRLLSTEKRLDLVIVDYLQLMSGSKASKKGDSSREREIAEITRNLKELAKELKVPIMILSQLNRGVETRQDKRPGLADLRESGAIEQDADIVCFIHRDDYYNKDSDQRGVAELIIAKNRAGPTDTIRLAWMGQYTLFANLASDQTNAPHQGSRPPPDISL